MIINLTQHPSSAEQRALGVIDLAGDELAALRDTLTFASCPTRENILARAGRIAELACHNGLGKDDDDDPQPTWAMIGGAGYLMPALEDALLKVGVKPLHAFTQRVVEESVGTDGAVTKTAVFRHAGWVDSV